MSADDQLSFSNDVADGEKISFAAAEEETSIPEQKPDQNFPVISNESATTDGADSNVPIDQSEANDDSTLLNDETRDDERDDDDDDDDDEEDGFNVIISDPAAEQVRSLR